jgi:hypothetical protein
MAARTLLTRQRRVLAVTGVVVVIVVAVTGGRPAALPARLLGLDLLVKVLLDLVVDGRRLERALVLDGLLQGT